MLSLFTLPFASAAGSGARLSLGSAKGVRVLFKNPDDLIKAAGKLERGKRGSRIGYVKGNADEIFNSLTRGVTERTPSGKAFKLDDGTILRKYVSSGGLPTIQIHKSSGQIYKIRIK